MNNLLIQLQVEVVVNASKAAAATAAKGLGDRMG